MMAALTLPHVSFFSRLRQYVAMNSKGRTFLPLTTGARGSSIFGTPSLSVLHAEAAASKIRPANDLPIHDIFMSLVLSESGYFVGHGGLYRYFAGLLRFDLLLCTGQKFEHRQLRLLIR